MFFLCKSVCLDIRTLVHGGGTGDGTPQRSTLSPPRGARELKRRRDQARTARLFCCICLCCISSCPLSHLRLFYSCVLLRPFPPFVSQKQHNMLTKKKKPEMLAMCEAVKHINIRAYSIKTFRHNQSSRPDQSRFKYVPIISNFPFIYSGNKKRNNGRRMRTFRQTLGQELKHLSAHS